MDNITFYLYGHEKKHRDRHCKGNCGGCHCHEENIINCGYENECEYANDTAKCLVCPCNNCGESCIDCKFNTNNEWEDIDFDENDIDFTKLDDAGRQLLQRMDKLGLLRKSKASDNSKESKTNTIQKFRGKTVIELFEIGEEDLANNIITCWTSRDIEGNNIRIEGLRFGDSRLMCWNFDGKEVIASLADFTALLMTRA